VVVTGRAISATHEAGGSARGQAVCMATGHAAGVLAGLASRERHALREIEITEVQNVLTRQGAILFYADSSAA
jgi:FAD-dependent oxidoreductase family protein